MTEPSKYKEVEKEAELERQMMSFILQQLSGSIDEIRARATWAVYLDTLIEKYGTELIARAMSSAIHCASREAGFTRHF